MERVSNLSKEQKLKVRDICIRQPLLYETQLKPLLFSVGRQLTSLSLVNVLDPEDVPIFGILSLCPQLTVLGLLQKECITAYRREQDQESLELSHHLRLRSLTIEMIDIGIDTLWSLVERCPELMNLHIARLPSKRGDAPTIPNNQLPISSISFLKHAMSFCPKLNEIHFSFNEIPAWSDLTHAHAVNTLEIHSRVKNWSFLSRDLKPVILESLNRTHSKILTSLEIVEFFASYEQIRLLHKFLCESPHLLHLKALDTYFPVAWFDLEGILDRKGILHKHKRYEEADSAGRSITPFHRKIWACRKLRTLHMKFIFDEGVKDSSPECSRLLFGYLGRVCPKLEDLEISQGSGIPLDLESGFCLLSRLHNLRELCIKSKSRLNSWWYLDWMTRRMSPIMKAKMKLCIARLGLTERGTIYAKTPFAIGKNSLSSLEINGVKFSGSGRNLDYMIDGVDMRNLGQKRDIIELLQDRLSRNWVCWPTLEYLYVDTLLGPRFSRSFRKTIRNLRPEVEQPNGIFDASLYKLLSESTESIPSLLPFPY
ncbi:hypothetical protein BGZ76_008356 [Entomortierella beljakovae]|nr:hypothetical protein BGZ76_008356 [Entomortierella beljakovae]